MKKLDQEKQAQPLIDQFDPYQFKASNQDLFLSAKRNEKKPGAYEKFAEKFDPKNGYNHLRKTQLIEKNIHDFGNEQKRFDMMQSYFLQQHQNDMSNLQKYRKDQLKLKQSTERFEKAKRQDFAKNVEIVNDKINVKNDAMKKKLHQRDEVRADSINLNKTSKEFQYYQKFMHSGIDQGKNSNLVKKYIKMNYND